MRGPAGHYPLHGCTTTTAPRLSPAPHARPPTQRPNFNPRSFFLPKRTGRERTLVSGRGNAEIDGAHEKGESDVAGRRGRRESPGRSVTMSCGWPWPCACVVAVLKHLRFGIGTTTHTHTGLQALHIPCPSPITYYIATLHYLCLLMLPIARLQVSARQPNWPRKGTCEGNEQATQGRCYKIL